MHIYNLLIIIYYLFIIYLLFITYYLLFIYYLLCIVYYLLFIYYLFIYLYYKLVNCSRNKFKWHPTSVIKNQIKFKYLSK